MKQVCLNLLPLLKGIQNLNLKIVNLKLYAEKDRR